MEMPNFGTQVDATAGDGSAYVPDMTHHHHIGNGGLITVEWDAPVANDTVYIATQTVAASSDTAVDYTIAESFGRGIVIQSTDAGTITVHGLDYLGQPMSEELTTVVGDVDSTKAFKKITRLVAGSNLAGDITVKAGQIFGLPVTCAEVVRELVDGIAGGEGTFVAADSTDPASASTGDSRGTYNPSGVPNGSRKISTVFQTTNDLAGGLYGVAQG